MGWFKRKLPGPYLEDHRTEKVIDRLESVAARMERMTETLEAQFAAEEAEDAERRDR